MTHSKIKVLAISGSLRSGSYNSGLITAFQAASHDELNVTIYRGTAELPFFDQDLEGENIPASVLALTDAIRNADAVVISTPEYSGSIPGVLKNLIDWASRPYGASPFAGKPTAVLGASPSPYGAQRSQEQLVAVLNAIGAQVLGDVHPVGPATELFDDTGSLTSSEVQTTLRDIASDIESAVLIPALA